MRLRTLSIGAALALASAAPGLAQQPAQPAHGHPHPHSEKAPAAAAQEKAPEAFDAKVARRITPDEVKKRIDAGEKVVFIDTRSSFTGPMVTGAHHVPAGKVADWSKDLAKDTLIVAYCT